MPSNAWDEVVDDVLGGDQVVALAYVTPARGVVLTPMTNFGLRDRAAGTLSAINSSVGVSGKLERIAREPRIALAFHTRQLSFSDRPEYVLVQGVATLAAPVADYPRSVRAAWERFGGPVEVGRLWDRWLRIYNTRVVVTIAVERVVAWPDLACAGTPVVFGTPLAAAEPVPAQREPRGGTAPRVDHARAAARLARRPHRLLGWVGADGFPVVVPAEVAGAAPDGIALHVPDGLVPPGGRRAGMLAHWFARYTAGQDQRRHSGWLRADGPRRAVYAPHTEHGYRMPASMLAYRLAAGAATRWGTRPRLGRRP
jgi:hypothetical protein